MKNVAILGSQGVPANYGGFESLVENLIGSKTSDDIKYTVFCGGKDYEEHLDFYKGAKLKYIPFHANGLQSVIYDVLSMINCIGKGYDAVLILGVSGCLFLPVFKLFYKGRIIVNIDGLEHKRAKWNRFAKWFLRTSEKFAVKFADTVVSDNQCIQDYVKTKYGKSSSMIAYGGDHAIRDVSRQKSSVVLEKYSLASKKYCVSVCRIEPENNCHIILTAFAKSGDHLVFIGNWDRSEYGKELRKKYCGYSNIQIVNPVFDLDELYVLRSNARLYIHGHSAGGTNPSLVEAMNLRLPIAAFDVDYNRSTTAGKALYYKDSEQLEMLLYEDVNMNDIGDSMKAIANDNYLWKDIVLKYESLY